MTADEVLKQMQIAATLQSENPVCVIDAQSRTITVPEQYKLFGVENDKRVERIYFQCPKIVGDNQDLSQDYQLFMNYQNANGDPDAYHIDDMEVDGDNITFSWLLEENVTKYKGSIQIAFAAIIPGDTPEDPDKNRWNTTINTDCTCLVGLKCTEQVAESNPDALAQIWAAIDELKAGGASEEQIQQAVNKYMEENPIRVTTDASLTEDKVPADAKAVGDELKKKLKNSGWTANKYLGTDDLGNVVLKDAPEHGGSGEGSKVLSDSSEWMNGNFIYQNEKSVIFSVVQNRITTKYINKINSSRIKVECNSGYRYRVLFFTQIKNVNNGSQYDIVTGGYDDYSTWKENNRTLVVPEEALGYAVCMSKTDDSNMNTSECENISIYEISDDFDNTENILQNIFEQYNGKTLSILGDSISTYSGYIPDNNRSRYPEGDVDSVDKTYWKKIIDTLGMKLGVNESWAGSLVSWDGTTESNDIGEDKYIASENRISHLDDNGTPDIILIFAGTNDIGHDIELGSYGIPDSEQDINLLPVSTFSDAYMTMIMRVQYYYPGSKILVLTPSFAKYTSYTSYTPDRLNQYINKIIEVCEIMGVDIIDTRKIGFNMYNIDDFTIDGLHPNAKGMELLSDSILKKMWFKF